MDMPFTDDGRTAEIHTPCAVFYNIIAVFVGKRKNNEIDARILSREPFDKKGRSPYQRAMEDLTWRTREIIQKDPLKLSSELFLEPSVASKRVIGYLKTCGSTNEDILHVFIEDGAACMRDSLRHYQYDYHLFDNLLGDILRGTSKQLADCVQTVVTLFAATAFFGDPHKVANNLYIRERLAGPSSINGTRSYVDDNPVSKPMDRKYRIGVVRCFEDGSQSGEIHFFNPGESGTVIGRASTGDSVVTDVDPTVSREHLAIRLVDGHWMARGLSSTNGSKLMHKDGSVAVIESPLSSDEHIDVELEIAPGDKLFLGLGTMFKIVLVSL